jgi:DNA (cytosine-5)-methyltransferase 1
MKNKNEFRIATVFSGIGALEYALKRMGALYETAFAYDIDKFCKTGYFANYGILDEKMNGNLKHKKTNGN